MAIVGADGWLRLNAGATCCSPHEPSELDSRNSDKPYYSNFMISCIKWTSFKRFAIPNRKTTRAKYFYVHKLVSVCVKFHRNILISVEKICNFTSATEMSPYVNKCTKCQKKMSVSIRILIAKEKSTVLKYHCMGFNFLEKNRPLLVWNTRDINWFVQTANSVLQWSTTQKTRTLNLSKNLRWVNRMHQEHTEHSACKWIRATRDTRRLVCVFALFTLTSTPLSPVHTSNNVEATLSTATSQTILSTKSKQIKHVQFVSTSSSAVADEPARRASSRQTAKF